MKKCAVMICLLCFCVSCALAEGQGWTEETWAQVRSDLLRDEVAEPVPENRRLHVDPGDVDAAEGLPDNWLHVLVLGTDSPDMERNFGRTDALMLVSIHTETGEVRVLSLPEYALMPVEGLPESVMLRYVNCFGGPLLTVRELNRALGLNIRRYCAINLRAFPAIMDALGGVKLTITEAEARVLGVEPGSGVLLTGEQCLRYIKIRSVGDGGLRVQRLLRAAAGQVLRPGGMTAVFGLADQILLAVDTNLSLAEIASTLMTVLEHTGSGVLMSRDLPAEADDTLGPEAVRVWREFIYGEVD